MTRSHHKVTQPKRPATKPRPVDPELGSVITENGQTLVYTGSGLWAWFPSTATSLRRFAVLNGWGARTYRSTGTELKGVNSEGDRIVRSYVKIILTIGREAGTTRSGASSKAYTYRLVWDSSRTGMFELVRWHRRTSTDPAWTEFRLSELRAVIALHAVPAPTEVNTDG